MIRWPAIACLLTAALWVTDTRTHASALLVPHVQPVGVATIDGLPTDLQWPDEDATQPVVTAVAADIDADGDLDVVANQGSLELAVWVNDGTGRLTRATPHPSGSGQLAPSPGVADGDPGQPVPVTAAVPTFDAAVSATLVAPLSGSGTPTGPPGRRLPVTSFAVSPPRAPPADQLV